MDHGIGARRLTTRQRWTGVGTSTALIAVVGMGVAAARADGGAAHDHSSAAHSASAHHDSPASAGSAAPPSAAAGMVCGDEIRGQVARTFGLAAARSTSTRSGDRFSCTYHVAGGHLVLSVVDAPSSAAAAAEVGAARAEGSADRRVSGLASLGLPGYESADGVVVFRKDDAVLEVDARRLPAAVGPARLSRADVAYQLATDVLACWTGS